GLVGPVGDAVSTGGRPSSQFAIAASGRVVLGVDVGASHVRIAVSDLTGRIQAESSERIRVAEGPEAVLSWVSTAAHELLEQLGRAPGDLLAIGIGLPGPVEHSSGRPINPPIMPGWDRFDVPGWFRDSFDAPVLVDNDVNIMALGERELSWPEVDHLIFVKVATGIGSGVISGGILQRGAQGTAGDLGHVFVPRAGDVTCRCGNQGCLEAVAAVPALAAGLRAAGVAVEGDHGVVGLVRGGDPLAVQMVRQAGRDLGEVLAVLVNMMNPSVIVIGGSLAVAGESLLAGIRETVYQRSLPLATEHLRIVTSLAGERAGVLGAAALAIGHVLSADFIEAAIEQPAIRRPTA
ncbi:MAG: ROK family protein, partial [Nocardioides sp.]